MGAGESAGRGAFAQREGVRENVRALPRTSRTSGTRFRQVRRGVPRGLRISGACGRWKMSAGRMCWPASGCPAPDSVVSAAARGHPQRYCELRRRRWRIAKIPSKLTPIKAAVEGSGITNENTVPLSLLPPDLVVP